MATSSDFSTTNQYIKYDIVVTENSTNVANNTSNVTVKVRCWRTNTGYTTYGTGTCYCGINGTMYSNDITPDDEFTYNSYTEIFNRTLDIGHNADGTKSIWVSAYIDHQRFSSDDQGFTVNLSTIPRASSISSVSGGTFGSAVTVNISRASSSFTHTVIFSFGNKSQQVTGAGTSASFTPSAATYGTEISNTMSGTGYITLITYNGNTEIGRTGQNITMTLPAYTPPCSTPTIAEAASGIPSRNTESMFKINLN